MKREISALVHCTQVTWYVWQGKVGKTDTEESVIFAEHSEAKWAESKGTKLGRLNEEVGRENSKTSTINIPPSHSSNQDRMSQQ